MAMMDQLYGNYNSLKAVRTLQPWLAPFDYQFITRYKLFSFQYDMVGDRVENIGWLNEY